MENFTKKRYANESVGDSASFGDESVLGLRLHKYMSQAGICSRRKAEEYIER